MVRQRDTRRYPSDEDEEEEELPKTNTKGRQRDSRKAPPEDEDDQPKTNTKGRQRDVRKDPSKDKDEDKGRKTNDKGRKQNSRKNPAEDEDDDDPKKAGRKEPVEKFGVPWMDESYDGVTYPEPTCVEVMQKVNNALATRVTQPQGSELKQQALFSLLGPEFTDQHFPYHKYNVKILDTPKIKPHMKEKYVEEMREFLMRALDQALKDCQYPKDLTAYDEDNELGRYLQKVRKNFREGLKKHTEQVLRHEEKKKTEKKKQDKEKKKASRRDDDSDDDDDDDDDASDDDDKPNSKQLDQSKKPSDICSEALLALMAQDNAKKQEFLKKIHEKHLGFSVPLRQHFWLDYLKAKEVKKQQIEDDQEALKTIEKNFHKTLSKEMKSQKVSRAIRSNSWKAIDHSVIEAYDNTCSLRLLDNDEHLIQTVRALNIHTVYAKDRFAEPNVNWLMPLQMAYPYKGDGGEDAHVMKLATYLDLVLRYCHLPIPKVYDMADDVVKTVQNNDEQYYNHIISCLETQVNRINVMDFPAEVLLEDQKASAMLYKELSSKKGNAKIDPEDLEIFTDPTIFVRMWIIQGYAGVVSIPAGLWVWDELFMNKWSPKYLHDVGVAILSLIKPWMLRANMYSGARKVFLDEPAKIYLSDLRKSVMHLQAGGAYDDLPDNRNYLPSKGKNQKDKGKNPKGDKKDDDKDKHGKMDKEKDKKPEKPTYPGPRGNLIIPFATERRFEVSLDLQSDSDSDDDSLEMTALPVYEPEPDTESESEPELLLDPEPEPPPRKPTTVFAPIPLPPPRSPIPPPPRQRTPPPPPPQRSPTPPPPQRSLTPPPPTPPPPKNEAWVPYDKKHTPTLPAATKVSEPCDFYIDSVRFLPDNISHCKVTGRIINMYISEDKNAPDILAYPVLDSQTRCPKFKFKLCLNKPNNKERLFLNPEMVIILRIYGYENHTKRVVVVGSCLLRVFKGELKPPQLCVGGWQIRIRHGLPNPTGGLEDLDHTDMDDNIPIYGTTVCVRFLPASKDYVPAPKYKTGYYQNEGTTPTESEKRIYKHYLSRDDYKSSLVGDHLRKMLSLEEKAELPNGPALESKIKTYMETTLDQKEQQKKSKEQVPNIDYTHYIRYCPKVGLKANVLAVFGLPVYQEHKFCQVYCEVLPGKDTTGKPKGDGYGGYQRFITKKVNFLSAQRSPEWDDEGSTLRPLYDDKAILLLQIYGFQPRYIPGDGTYPGALRDAKSDKITFKYDSPLAWGITQLFDKDCIISGVHWVPLYKGKPDPKVLEMLGKAGPAHKVMLLANKKEMVKYHDGSSIEVKIWDGHMDDSDLRDGRHEDQIDETKQEEKYVKIHKTIFAQNIDEFILEHMEPNRKKQGPVGNKFEKERQFFLTEANYHFTRAMNDALKEAGKKALPAAR